MSAVPNSTNPPEAQFILYEQIDPTIVRITLNRGDKHNAQSTRFLYELNAAFDRGAQDPEVKVIILAANGKNFSAGHDMSGDLSDRAAVYAQYPQVTTASRALQSAPGAEGRLAREEEQYVGFSERWRNLQKITIAQVQGKCIAAGVMLAWPCDIITASEDAMFSDVTVAMGSMGVEWFNHPWELGIRRAKQMLLTGDPVSAQDARMLGMVNEVYPRDQLAEKTLEMARKIAKQPQFSLHAVKMACNAAQDAQGRQVAMTTAFSLHHLCHNHCAQVYGNSGVMQSGIHPSVLASRERAAAAKAGEEAAKK